MTKRLTHQEKAEMYVAATEINADAQEMIGKAGLDDAAKERVKRLVRLSLLAAPGDVTLALRVAENVRVGVSLLPEGIQADALDAVSGILKG